MVTLLRQLHSYHMDKPLGLDGLFFSSTYYSILQFPKPLPIILCLVPIILLVLPIISILSLQKRVNLQQTNPMVLQRFDMVYHRRYFLDET